MKKDSHKTSDTAQHTTLRQQLLRSHIRVAGLAALVLVLAAVAMQMLREPITTIRLVNVPSANAAMTVQLGLQRSEANLCLLYTSPSPRDATLSRMPSSA